MKFFLIIFSLVLFPSFAFARTFDHDLYYGMQESNNVKELQKFLTDNNFYSGLITGNFFSLTLTSVKKFQAASAITPASGYFGPKSRAKANELLVASGISKDRVVTENGTTASIFTTPTNAANDAVNSLNEQIKILQQQLALLQQQTRSQQQGQQIARQTQTPEQIMTPQQTVTSQQTATRESVSIQPISVPIPSSPSPTPTPTPTPTTTLLLPKLLNYGGKVSWPNGNGYGNVNDSCNNCVVLITTIPTTANIYLMESNTFRGGLALDSFAISNPQTIFNYTDNNLSTTHVFLFSHMNMDETKKYLFIVDATDQSGTKYVQQFGGVDSNSTYLSGPFKWGENQTINWVNDYPSQYMKSNYYVDVPLTAVY